LNNERNVQVRLFAFPDARQWSKIISLLTDSRAEHILFVDDYKAAYRYWLILLYKISFTYRFLVGCGHFGWYSSAGVLSLRPKANEWPWSTTYLLNQKRERQTKVGV
jgi:hypothetical protein